MPAHRFTLRRPTAVTVTAGIVAAALAYATHHAPLLAGHESLTVLVVVLGSVAIGLAAAAATPEPLLRPIVVASTGAARVRPALPGDMPAIARLHAEALPHGFLAGLGQRFLRSYDRTFADSPAAVALVAEVGDHPLGFLLGVVRPEEHAAWLRRKRRTRLAGLGALALLLRPPLLLRFLRTRVARYARAWRGASAATAPSKGSGSPAVLSHVAVEPAARGLGAGRLLVEAFGAAARDAGAPEARLLTVSGEQGATTFYRRLGWQPRDRRPAAADAPAMDELVLRFEDGPAG